MSNPIPILDEILLILSPLSFQPADASVVYPQVAAKLKELRDLKVDEDLPGLIDDSTQVMLGMKPGRFSSGDGACCYRNRKMEERKSHLARPPSMIVTPTPNHAMERTPDRCGVRI
jgi:hypothetical protein